MGHEMCPDDGEKIVSAIHSLLERGAQLILTTGGHERGPGRQDAGGHPRGRARAW